MNEVPEDYQVIATAEAEGNVILKAEDLPQLVTAPHSGSGGSGDQWSPEMLLVATVLDGFILEFKSISRASQFHWDFLSCRIVGNLGEIDGIKRFTSFRIEATLTVPRATGDGAAAQLMEKANANCVIANSLNAETLLELEILAPS
jgi:organic hydroperoxide reductase OsmC/OhrA